MSSPERWVSCMRQGRFAAAWSISDALLRTIAADEWQRPRHQQRVWQGRSIAGQRVLVRCYHGLGDTVHFVRYVPLLAATAREVTLWIQAPLIPLVERMPGIDRILPLHDGDPGVEADVSIEIMELAHVFRTTLDTIPCLVPYITAPEASAPRPPGRRPAIGIGWRAGGWDAGRSMPVELAAAIVRGVPCDVHVLQRELAPGEELFFSRPGPDSLADLAATIASLDLVITVDTLFAHLAGALGKPTWLLLHASPDWRWMLERDDSPWYPTMRLFRQTPPGGWDAVADQVRDALVLQLQSRNDLSIRSRGRARDR